MHTLKMAMVICNWDSGTASPSLSAGTNSVHTYCGLDTAIIVMMPSMS